jgi:hypothetical protein
LFDWIDGELQGFSPSSRKILEQAGQAAITVSE